MSRLSEFITFPLEYVRPKSTMTSHVIGGYTFNIVENRPDFEDYRGAEMCVVEIGGLMEHFTTYSEALLWIYDLSGALAPKRKFTPNRLKEEP